MEHKIEIEGRVDAFRSLGNGRTRFGGWAMTRHEGAAYPVDEISIEGTARSIEVAVRSRKDVVSAAGGDLGFEFVLPRPVDFIGLLTGDVQVVARAGGEEQIVILREESKQQMWSAALSELDLRRLGQDARSVERLLAEVFRTGRPAAATRSVEPSPVTAGVGFRSFDGTALVGRDGFMFLRGGTNNLEEQYLRPATESIGRRWNAVIMNRAERLGAASSGYTQLIVPEKQSVMHEWYPEGIQGKTKNLELVEDECSDNGAYLDVYLTLRAQLEGGVPPYRKVDTHLSAHGAREVAQRIAERITGRSLVPETIRFEEQTFHGDLGSKFGVGNLSELQGVPASDDDFARMAPVLSDSRDPANGAHLGVIRHWKTHEPRSEARVFIFGSSMFSRGDRPFGLSWWVSRLFREVKFVWSIDCDDAVVDDFRPDFVVCQTVERFLPRIPTR